MLEYNNEIKLSARINALLECCADNNILVTPLKLQKMAYLHYAVHLIHGGAELDYFQFEAWKLGPVLRSVYDYYKTYGKRGIRTKIAVGDKYYSLQHTPSINETVAKYGSRTASQLVAITHIEGGAWDQAYKKGPNTRILPEDIKREFGA